MQQEISGQFHGIVPAKILEIDERQRPVASAQAVVEAEIGGHEAAPFLREFSCKIKAGRRHLGARLLASLHRGRQNSVFNKINKFRLVSEIAQARQPYADLPLDLLSTKTRLRREWLLRSPGRH